MDSSAKAFGSLLLVALAAACGSQAALNSQQAKKVALAYRYSAGTTRTYDFDITMDARSGSGALSQPIDETMNATMVYKVLSVAPDGTATIQMTMHLLNMKMNGRSLPAQSNSQSYTLQISKNGTVVSGGGFTMNAGGGGLPGSDQFASLLPDHAVKPGDTWDVAVNRANPLGSGSFHMTTRNKFLRWDAFRGHQDAVIESKGTLPAGMSIDMSKFAQLANTPGMPAMHGTLTEAGTVTIDETSWVEESTGQLDKSANHMTMNITMTFPAGFAGSAGGGSTKLTGTMTMNLAIS